MSETMKANDFVSLPATISKTFGASKPIDVLETSTEDLLVKDTSRRKSLYRLMSSQGALKSIHSAALPSVDNFRHLPNNSKCSRSTRTQRISKSVSFCNDSARPMKRRRFERRNSKTPTMLMSMSPAASLFQLDFGDNEENEERNDDDNWDGGIKLAEDVVKQLLRRHREARKNKDSLAASLA